MTPTDATPQHKQKVRRWPWFMGGGLLITLVLVGVYTVRSHAEQGETNAVASPEMKRIPVVVTRPRQQMFERAIVTQGNVEAKKLALVSPRIPGTLESIDVDEGDWVMAGETRLFQTDSVKLAQAVVIAEHDLAVAQCAQRQAQASLEKVEADLHKGQLDFKRSEQLIAEQAITPDAFENQQSRYQQLLAGHKLAAAQVALVAEQANQAAAALTISQKDLSDTTVLAPINGVVSERFREPGERGMPGEEVVRIEDTTLVEICAFLPATAYPEVVVGQTKMRVTVSGVDLGDQVIAYKSPTIDPKMRTFEVKCLMQDPPSGVAPGALAQVAVVLDEREAWGLPVQAVQTRNGQSVVFVVEAQAARQRVVETGYTQDGRIELLQGDITELQSVVTMGQYQLDDGVAVSIQEGDK